MSIFEILSKRIEMKKDVPWTEDRKLSFERVVLKRTSSPISDASFSTPQLLIGLTSKSPSLFSLCDKVRIACFKEGRGGSCVIGCCDSRNKLLHFGHGSIEETLRRLDKRRLECESSLFVGTG
jgi:hypothetical protein